jgi:hypothetical protein
MMSVHSEIVELNIRHMAQTAEKETTEVIHA